ncbi:MAG: GGDEF domain-containing protein [Coriobacteriia bacterium]|nr:GGDEF domain-containing protein [Coriobacteriia bacterium]
MPGGGNTDSFTQSRPTASDRCNGSFDHSNPSDTSRLERTRRRIVLVFSSATAVLGLVALPLFVYDVFGLGTPDALEGLRWMVIVGATLQASVFIAVRLGARVEAGAAVTVAVQVGSAACAAVLLVGSSTLAMAALMFLPVAMMLASAVLSRRGVQFAGALITAVVLAIGAYLYQYHGLLIVFPPLLVLVSGGFIAFFTADTARELDASDSRHRRESARLAIEASTDPLTGLLNRRGFVLAASTELAAARREGSAMNLAYLDVDGLKRVNDRLGHAAGDDLLCGVAELLRAGLRSADMIARVGGDEFAVLAWQTADEDADRFSQRLASSLRALRDVRGAAVRVSLGVVHVPVGDAREFQELVAEADTLMYRDKDRGRRASALDLSTAHS